MNKAKRDTKIIGHQAFNEYYRGLTQTEAEYQALLHSLALKNTPCILINPLHWHELKLLWQDHGLRIEPLPWFPHAIRWPKERAFPALLPGHDAHWFYVLNPASLLPVVALEIQTGETVLDACAAPGGKTLAIQWSCASKNITLVANELSPKRFSQLKKDIKSYGSKDMEIAHLPAEIIAIKVGAAFDKILLDAPCSSEKHVLHNPLVLNAWSPKRITKLVERQYRLIKSLYNALKVGGILVYSTCAINTQENEAIVGRVLKKMKDRFELIDLNHLPSLGSPGLEGAYEFQFDLRKVRRVMPHVQAGYDPMFIARFRRIT